MSPLIPHDIEKHRFSIDFDDQAARLLNEKHVAKLKDNEGFWLETFHTDYTVLLRAYLGSTQKAHEFELFLEDKVQNTDESFHLLLDFLDGVLEEFFAHGREGGLPLNFCEHQYEKIKIFARQEFRDFAAERMADEFLKNHLDK